jgi:signal peptidase I
MNREEIQVWLGLRRADLFVYLACAAIIGIYLVNETTVELVLGVLPVLLTLAACLLGMRASPRVSGFTNAAKKLAYASCVVPALFFIGYRYVGYYCIPQNGMYPALSPGTRFLTIRRPYRTPAQVARGDIILFTGSDQGVAYRYIWRVIGLPGDTVRTAGDDVIGNGVPLNRQKVRSEGELAIYRETNGEAFYEIALPEQAGSPRPPDVTVTVPAGQFFVLGDNRHQARDSRYLGCIPFEAIIGKKW